MGSLLTNLIEILNIEFVTILTAALPIIELRGAIPFGISLGLSPIHSVIISFIGSMIPAPIILFTIRPIFNRLKETRLFHDMVERLIDRSNNKSGRVQKYGFWGLLLFVAIPLPGTGVWSGALAAALLDMRFKLAFPAIFIGNLIAAIVIMGFSHGFISVLSFI